MTLEAPWGSLVGNWLLVWRGLTFALALTISFLSLSACATLNRLPAVPLAMAPGSVPLGVTHARFYAEGDVATVEAISREVIENRKRFEGASLGIGKFAKNHYLAISGGGDDGAFGAGLLLGWTKRGDRPSFRIVTGISTGALSAPFAFLGSEYDSKLKAVYTDTAADDIFTKRTLLAAVADDAMTDTTPLRNMIARYVDNKMIARIAEEYGKGRLLLIATTNLDQARSVIWNIGAIAKSGDPRARDLIIEVLRASASIPGVFPPVMLDVTVNEKQYQEMHVDGGTVAQSFLYPPSFSIRRAARLGTVREASDRGGDGAARNQRLGPGAASRGCSEPTLSVAQIICRGRGTSSRSAFLGGNRGTSAAGDAHTVF